jgi:hypothetical protein
MFGFLFFVYFLLFYYGCASKRSLIKEWHISVKAKQIDAGINGTLYAMKAMGEDIFIFNCKAGSYDLVKKCSPQLCRVSCV